MNKTIEEELKDIKTELKEIKEILSRIEGSCGNMDSHISFVNNTYTALRTPIDFFKRNFERLSGNVGEELPRLENISE